MIHILPSTFMKNITRGKKGHGQLRQHRCSYHLRSPWTRCSGKTIIACAFLVYDTLNAPRRDIYVEEGGNGARDGTISSWWSPTCAVLHLSTPSSRPDAMVSVTGRLRVKKFVRDVTPDKHQGVPGYKLNAFLGTLHSPLHQTSITPACSSTPCTPCTPRPTSFWLARSTEAPSILFTHNKCIIIRVLYESYTCRMDS